MGTFKDIYDIVKDLRDTAKEVSNQPMIDLAVKIQDRIFDLKNEMEELRDENHDLKKIIEDLKVSKDIESHIIPLSQPIFRLDTDKEKSFYCQNCWENERKLYKVTTFYMNGEAQYKCNHCKNSGFAVCDIRDEDSKN